MNNLIKANIEFAPGVRSKQKCILVGKYLLISFTDETKRSFSIYNVKGYPLLDGASWKKENSAVQVAENLSRVYEHFFPLWEEYPKADVFSLAKWTIDNGIDIVKFLKENFHGKENL